MTTRSIRRRLLTWTPAALLAACGEPSSRAASARGLLTLYTFGDSILDCARYNAHGVHPGQLIVRNDDALFPQFKGHDLRSRGEARLEHRAVDGATIAGLPSQARCVERGVVAAGRQRELALCLTGAGAQRRGDARACCFRTATIVARRYVVKP